MGEGFEEKAQDRGLPGVVGLKTASELKEAAGHSYQGFVSTLLGEKAFRTDLLVFAICSCAAILIPGLSWCERAVMIYVAFAPLVAELTNTAIEKTIDRISTERHRLSGLVKDVGSALVAFAFIGAGICWLVILLGWSLRYFGG